MPRVILQLLFLPPSAGGMGGDAFDVYRVFETIGSFDPKPGKGGNVGRRSLLAPRSSLPFKADGRIDGDGLALLGRIWARHAALHVGTAGASLFGADSEKVGLGPICAAQAGDLDDRDQAADYLYRSTCKRQGRTSATVVTRPLGGPHPIPCQVEAATLLSRGA